MHNTPKVLTVAAALLILPVVMPAAYADALADWLDRQARLETWSADVEQTRTLRALVKPLVAKGRVVYSRPQRFRWQLGDPPRTLAVGTQSGLTVVYPRLKQVERYPQSDDVDARLAQVLDLLEVGFPSSAADFNARYALVSTDAQADVTRFRLQPRDADARRMLDNVEIEVSTQSLTLLSTAFEFPDGSRMHNRFENVVADEPVDDSLFELDVDENWTVVDPLGP